MLELLRRLGHHAFNIATLVGQARTQVLLPTWHFPQFDRLLRDQGDYIAAGVDRSSVREWHVELAENDSGLHLLDGAAAMRHAVEIRHWMGYIRGFREYFRSLLLLASVKSNGWPSLDWLPDQPWGLSAEPFFA
jgi:hypothetical protein